MKDFQIQVSFGENLIRQFIQAMDWRSAKDAAMDIYVGGVVREVVEVGQFVSEEE